jgi:hypothetical protein
MIEDPNVKDRGLTVVGGGAYKLRPHRMREDTYIDYPEGRDAVFLESLQALVPGGGAEVLKMLCEESDKTKLPIILVPTGYATTLRPTPMTTEQLTAYYAKFGFKPLRSFRPGKWSATILVRPS